MDRTAQAATCSASSDFETRDRTIAMLFGGPEPVSVLVLFTPAFWHKCS